MIQFKCKKCGWNLSVEEKYVGKKGKCTKCGQLFTTPAQSESLPQPAAQSKPPLAIRYLLWIGIPVSLVAIIAMAIVKIGLSSKKPVDVPAVPSASPANADAKQSTASSKDDPNAQPMALFQPIPTNFYGNIVSIEAKDSLLRSVASDAPPHSKTVEAKPQEGLCFLIVKFEPATKKLAFQDKYFSLTVGKATMSLLCHSFGKAFEDTRYSADWFFGPPSQLSLAFVIPLDSSEGVLKAKDETVRIRWQPLANAAQTSETTLTGTISIERYAKDGSVASVWLDKGKEECRILFGEPCGELAKLDGQTATVKGHEGMPKGSNVTVMGGWKPFTVTAVVSTKSASPANAAPTGTAETPQQPAASSCTPLVQKTLPVAQTFMGRITEIATVGTICKEVQQDRIPVAIPTQVDAPKGAMFLKVVFERTTKGLSYSSDDVSLQLKDADKTIPPDAYSFGTATVFSKDGSGKETAGAIFKPHYGFKASLLAGQALWPAFAFVVPSESTEGVLTVRDAKIKINWQKAPVSDTSSVPAQQKDDPLNAKRPESIPSDGFAVRVLDWSKENGAVTVKLEVTCKAGSPFNLSIVEGKNEFTEFTYTAGKSIQTMNQIKALFDELANKKHGQRTMPVEQKADTWQFAFPVTGDAFVYWLQVNDKRLVLAPKPPKAPLPPTVSPKIPNAQPPVVPTPPSLPVPQPPTHSPAVVQPDLSKTGPLGTAMNFKKLATQPRLYNGGVSPAKAVSPREGFYFAMAAYEVDHSCQFRIKDFHVEYKGGKAQPFAFGFDYPTLPTLVKPDDLADEISLVIDDEAGGRVSVAEFKIKTYCHGRKNSGKTASIFVLYELPIGVSRATLFHGQAGVELDTAGK